MRSKESKDKLTACGSSRRVMVTLSVTVALVTRTPRLPLGELSFLCFPFPHPIALEAVYYDDRLVGPQ